MKRLLGIFIVTMATLLVWAMLVFAGAREGWWRPMVAARGDTAGFLHWAMGRYDAESKGNIAIMLLDHGRVAQTYFASHGRAVDRNSLFQVASLSKWITAWGVMTLVQEHRIDLDAPVSRYLTRWHLPPSTFDNNDVTVRRLLSHTAGLTDHLGFLGYPPGQNPPTIEQELTHPGDAEPGTGRIQVGAAPGDTWRYSGGGYLILQLLIEEVTHEPFNDYMRRAVLKPLGMSESTFVDPDPAHLADFYGPDGSIVPRDRFAAVAAASLYTSAADMTRFLQAQAPGAGNASPGRGVLHATTLEAMRKPQAFLYGLPFLPVWGMGESLYVPNSAGSYVVGHDGDNLPAINTTARIDPATGDGIVVLNTGNIDLAREIGGEWTFWHAGRVSLDTLVVFDEQSILDQLAWGAAVILIAGILMAGVGSRLANR